MSESEIQIEVFGKTDVGLIREHNEDNLLIADLGGGFNPTIDERLITTHSPRYRLTPVSTFCRSVTLNFPSIPPTIRLLSTTRP